MACTLLGTLSDGRYGCSYRFGAVLIAVLSSSTGFYSAPCWAKHNKSLPSVPTDPCEKMRGYMNTRLAEMKGIKKTLDQERSVPDTVAGFFDLMQGKPYVDQPKTQKLAQMRREADDLNEAMRVSGCATVDIDQELTKPAVPTLPSAKKKGQASDPMFPGKTTR